VAAAKVRSNVKKAAHAKARAPGTGPRAEAELRAFALSLPGTREEFPWGDRVIKVNKKVFVFMGTLEGGGLGLSTKLPETGDMALALPFASPTRYGLGKSGWVSARFGAHERPPIEMLKAWIEESYRAIAPKRIVAGMKEAATTVIRKSKPAV
jgi:predicted DNA-binding protein (MmcQ/YjbR family)